MIRELSNLKKIPIVISVSQQCDNPCVMGDTEANHCRVIGKLYKANLDRDARFVTCLIPQIPGTQDVYLPKVAQLSDAFIKANGGRGVHNCIHSDGGYRGSGASAFCVSKASPGGMIAKAQFDEICALTPWPDMVFVEKPGLYEIKYPIGYTSFLELSFHDRPDEAKFLHQNAQQLADALTRGLYKALEWNPVNAAKKG
jgi:hypothetical protein